MVQFDNQYRQVKIKIVYYGPALGGKTTCLQHLHTVLDPQRRTRLYTLRTASDRTLFFDLLSLDLGRVRGYRLALQLFTVPGQVQYNATRKAVLGGADGIVFVADSQPSQREPNRESLANLHENLTANGLDPETMPLVIQLNKRDLTGVMSRSEMEADLNPRGCPVFETVATDGQQVVEAFQAATEATVLAVADRLGLAGQQEALDRLTANVRAAFAAQAARPAEAPADAPVVIEPESGATTLREQELVAEAVRANMAMTELNARLDTVSRELETRVRQLRFLNEFGRLMSAAREPEEVTGGLLDRLLSELGVASGSLLLAADDGTLVELMHRGIDSDPMMAGGDGKPPAVAVLESRVGVLIRSDEIDPEHDETGRWADLLQPAGLVSALVVPLVAQDRAVGVVTAYADEHRRSFAESDLELASALGANAAVALANARAWRELEVLNRSLEDAVAARTRELEAALGEARELAAQLEERNRMLEDANRRLAELEGLKGDLLNRIAHEFNSPVTAIQTASRILSRYDQVPAEKVAKFSGIIAAEAGRLAELIGSAQQAVVLGATSAAEGREEVDIADLIKRALAPLKSEISERKLKVDVKMAHGLEHMSGVASQLEAALLAVVRNAVEFNSEGGTLGIVAQAVRRGSASTVEIRVTDSGAGIPEADLPHVHEAFWQGGELMTEKPRGLGLGLAVAQRVAESHGGGLRITSKPGQGTTVTLVFSADGTPA